MEVFILISRRSLARGVLLSGAITFIKPSRSQNTANLVHTPPLFVLGKLLAVDNDKIYLNVNGTPTTFIIGSGTIVWKGRNFNSTDVLTVGDELDVDYQVSNTGEQTATKITANLTKVEGLVKKLEGNAIQVLDDSSQTLRILQFDSNLLVNRGSAKLSDVKVGMRILVTGLQQSTTVVTPITVFLWNNGNPVNVTDLRPGPRQAYPRK